MSNKRILKWTIAFCMLIGIFSCKQKTETITEVIETNKAIKVFNFDDKEERSAYLSLNLDDSHPNLLNPQISKSELNAVVESWSDLHQQIGSFLSQNNFTWGVEDKSISILQKIYFQPNGEMKYYFFKVLTENVSEEKKAQFAELISEFARTHRIDYQLEQSFAQCGKTEYLNQ